jgi:hypothetical protein
MRKDADRYEDGEDDFQAHPDPGAVRDPNAYWRRRFFILGGGIAVVGLCVWLFPGADHATAHTTATANASMAALEHRGTLPPAAYGSPWKGPTPKKTAEPTVVATPSPQPSAKPSTKPSPASASKGKVGTGYHPAASPSPSTSPSASTAARVKGPRCAPSDIVLSLFTGQPSYGPGASPKFDVYAVSTSSSACTLSYGAGSVQVVVTRRGRVVWDSAACKPSAAAAVRFTLGVPHVLTVSWNRQAKEPSGCAGTLPAGAWGTFDAVALTDGQSSPVRSFTLSR